MKLTKTLLKIGKIIFIGILSVILLFNIISIIQRVVSDEQIPLIMGYGNAVIITGSMEPAISPGDIVVIHKQDDYEVGDIVTYMSNSAITHRIVEKTADGYVTQGDANNARDPEIEKSRIVGKVTTVIPQVGDILLFLQNPLHLLIVILLIFAVFEIPRLFRKRS